MRPRNLERASEVDDARAQAPRSRWAGQDEGAAGDARDPFWVGSCRVARLMRPLSRGSGSDRRLGSARAACGRA
jgi:hypothetical protein